MWYFSAILCGHWHPFGGRHPTWRLPHKTEKEGGQSGHYWTHLFLTQKRQNKEINSQAFCLQHKVLKFDIQAVGGHQSLGWIIACQINFPTCQIKFPTCKIIFIPAKSIFPPAKLIFTPAKIIFLPANQFFHQHTGSGGSNGWGTTVQGREYGIFGWYFLLLPYNW